MNGFEALGSSRLLADAVLADTVLADAVSADTVLADAVLADAVLAMRLWAWVVHPGLLAGGVLLAAVPLAIHWWSRRRVRTIDWAAMRLLAGAWRREERRTRLEDRALLALRVLAMIAAAVVIARPLRSTLPPAAGGASRADREWIVLLDDSLSMKTVGASGSAFDFAKRRLRELIEARAAAGQDTLTLLVATAPTTPRWERVPLAAARVDELLAAVDRLNCTDAAIDWPATLPAFDRWLAARSSPRRTVLVCSDFRERDWNPAASAATSPPSDAANLTIASDSWWLCDVGDTAVGNVAVAGLSTVGPIALGVPFDYLVAVRNTGSRPATEVRVRVSAANTAAQEMTIESLGAGETRTVSFPLRLGDSSAIPRPEEIAVELSLDSPETHNRLPADDTAVDLLFPVPAVEVAIVSNAFAGVPAGAAPNTSVPNTSVPNTSVPEPGSLDSTAPKKTVFDPATSNTTATRNAVPNASILNPSVPDASVASSAADTADSGVDEGALFLENAMAPAGPFATGFAVRRFAPSELTLEKLAAIRVLVWEDIGELSMTWLERLESWVDGGGALVLIPGPNADPQAWRNRLWREGTGLAPASLRAIQGDPAAASWRGFGIISPGYSAGRILDRAENPLIDQVKFFRWWDVESPAANVVARFAGPSAAPVMMEKAYGAGRVALLAVPLRNTWTDWPLDPSFVIFWQELTQSLAADRVLPQRTLAGAPLRVALPSRRYQASAWLRTPSKTREPLVNQVMETTAETTLETTTEATAKTGAKTVPARNARWELVSEPLLQSGPHVLELVDAAGRRVEHSFSVLTDPREGELQRVSLDWRPAGRLATARRVATDTPWTTLLEGPQEWWWWAALGLVATLAAEQWLAWNLGRRR